ncbi:MAG: DUF447 domain-containing protein [Gammaproteobacteria bacterium]|jgi:hypothetical protein
MIYEAVVSTRDRTGAAHFTPMGYRIDGDTVTLAPFVPSTTLENLRREPFAVINVTDDVSVIAGCLTGRRTWPAVATQHVPGFRLDDLLAHRELSITHCEDDAVRPTFRLETVAAQSHRAPLGYNRAQAAVLEAAILFTRLDWLDPAKVAREMSYLQIAVEKTAGPRESTAWQWITAAIQAHERHDLSRALPT